ncbi:metal ABC transporter ATP-binding protein [Oscillospiraceae bacterium PP1C4]
MSLITCQNVSLGYEGKTVLSDVNFNICSGDYLCVVGENGSGKSTLIKGLLKLKLPVNGTILTGDGLLLNEIGYLPQQTSLQKDFPASVYEVVLSGRLNSLGTKPFYTKTDKVAANEKMTMMGIEQLKHKSYQELSGGQQQRVLLARALCATKKLVLLDEPVAGLDPVVTSELYTIIKKINTEHQITIIMVSHDIAAAVKYASHILHLGYRQLFYGTTSDYCQSEVGKRFLGGADNDL